MRYSEEQVRRALELYMETMSVTKTIRQLRAKVSRSGFYKWTSEAQLPLREVKKPDLETKLNAAHRCFSLRRKGTISVQGGRLFKVEPMQMEEEAPRRIQADESGKEEGGQERQE